MTALLAVIELGFDPLLHIGGLAVRWQTVGVTVGLLVAFGLAVLLIPNERPTPTSPRFPDAPPTIPTATNARTPTRPRRPLRLDDMLLMVLGIVPGAVVGGRLVHAFVYFDAYAANPLSVLDPGVGTLSLLGAVIGGILSALYVAHLLDAPIRRWVDVAAVPLLFCLGFGKLAQLLGGSGQGLPFDGPWAVAFASAGPWVSSNPQIPSHPAQVYEGIWLLVGIPLVLFFAGRRRRPVRVHPYVAWADRVAADGVLFVGALAWFFAGRVLVGFTWRDDDLLGPLNMEQVLALLSLGLTLVLAARGIVKPTQQTTPPAAQEPTP